MTYRDDARRARRQLVVAVNGEIAAVDRRSGDERWRAAIHGAGLGHVALLASGGAVYAASEEELVICLDAESGTKRWEKATVAYGRATLLVDGEDLFIARGSHLECLDRNTGASRWSATVRGMGKGAASLVLSED